MTTIKPVTLAVKKRVQPVKVAEEGGSKKIRNSGAAGGSGDGGGTILGGISCGGDDGWKRSEAEAGQHVGTADANVTLMDKNKERLHNEQNLMLTVLQGKCHAFIVSLKYIKTLTFCRD